MAVDRLERIERQENSSHSVLSSISMAVFGGSKHTTQRQREELARTFADASEDTAEQLDQTITKAQVVLGMLRRLDEIQTTLNRIILREQRTVHRDGDELVCDSVLRTSPFLANPLYPEPIRWHSFGRCWGRIVEK